MVRWVTKQAERAMLAAINADRFLPFQIDITNACNLKCAHCYHSDHENFGALPTSRWFSLVTEYLELCKKLHFRPYFVICGGEPLSAPSIGAILQHIAECAPLAPVSVLSNGTLATPTRLKHLDLRPSVRFQISIDGPDARRHDLIRGPGRFAQALEGIDNLRKWGHSIDLLAVLSRKSAEWIPEFFDLANALPVKSMGFTRFISNGYGKTLANSENDAPLLPDELRAAYRTILIHSARTRVLSNTTSPLMHLLQDGLGRSGRFWEGIVVGYQGDILASSRSRLKLGHVDTHLLEEILLNDPTLRSIRQGHVETCGACPDYTICGGDRNAAYAATGNYLGADPGCWKK